MSDHRRRAAMPMWCRCLFFSILPALRAAAPAEAALLRARRPGRDDDVAYVGTNPLCVCWSRTAKRPGHTAAKGGSSVAELTSRLIFWRKRVVWQRAGIRGGALVTYLRRSHSIVWGAAHALHVVPLQPGRKQRVVRAPAGYVFCFWNIAADAGHAPLFSLGAERFNAPVFQPPVLYRILVIDPSRGTVASANMGGMPLALSFRGRSLLAGTVSVLAPGRERSAMESFAVRSGRGKVAVAAVARTRLREPPQSFAAALPVLVSPNGRRIFVGQTRVAAGAGAVSQVAGGSGQILIIKKNGQFGVAKLPRWRYQKLGQLGQERVIGIGRNDAGFWLATPGLRIVLISRSGKVRVETVKFPGSAG